MGGYAQACIRLLTGWMQSLASQMWSFFTNRNEGGLLGWIGANWKWILLVLCLIGAIIDLTVYLFRWEPIKVWKSYFRRRKERKHTGSSTEEEFAELYQGYDTADEETERFPYFPDNMQQPIVDRSHYYRPQQETAQQPQPVPDIRTAGTENNSNIAPSNAEYQERFRRPEQYFVPPDTSNTENETDGRSQTERNLEKVIGPRRRRIRVNELFGDPGEDAVHFEAPQPVIDQNEAYHAPVYPRNWKTNGDNRIEQ